MQKYVLHILGLLLVACIAACGSSGTNAAAPIVDNTLPTIFASYTATHIGGAVQLGPISTAAKFSNYTVSTLPHIARTAGFSNYSRSTSPPAMFNHPLDITTDGANFYVADYGNNQIRKITPDGFVTTQPVISFLYRPSGITTDGTNLYIVDSGYNRIQAVNIATGIATIIGSATGVAGSVDSTDRTAALFNQPIGITTDGKSLFVTDFNNATVRRIDLNNNYAVTTLAGASGASGTSDGLQGAARFNRPMRITTDGKNLYMTDFYSRTIRKIEISTGKVSTIAGSPGQVGSDDGTANGVGTAARFNQPNGITTDGINLYVTDSYQYTIRKIVIATGSVTTISGISGTAGIGGRVDSPGTPSFKGPAGITTDGISLFVADSLNNTIRKLH